MASQEMPWAWNVGRTVAVLTPVASLVFRAQIYLFAWSQANADSANRVLSPARDIASAILWFPLAFCDSLLGDRLSGWLYPWAGDYDLALWMGANAANALCWECVVMPLASRGVARMLSGLDAVSDVLWPL